MKYVLLFCLLESGVLIITPCVDYYNDVNSLSCFLDFIIGI